MIAYYFKDKNALMAATLSGAASAFRARLAQEAGDAPGLARLRKVFELSFPAGPGETYSSWPLWLEFAAESRRSPELGGQLRERISTIRADFIRCIGTTSGGGEVMADPELMADLLLALYHGLGVLMTASEETMPQERAHLVEQLAMSLLPPV
jgi:AcrR family transcriptional regulator